LYHAVFQVSLDAVTIFGARCHSCLARRAANCETRGPSPSFQRQSDTQFASNRELETSMNDEAFNLSIRKFLKMVGVNSQREIEQAVAKAIANGTIAGTEAFPARVTVAIAGLALEVNFDGEISLQ
jgi:uncharacterized protein DUF6494